ncbi:unnamed protein product [Rotaria magnacalcarata]|uniref:Uncharacterized protein n=1 Tax=Rotaria magnacalcarata TaxID=392030 RepID=A0A819ZPQ5_9BILA|nr:unnamed protein product [Rotaria magnacalcarata]
MIRLHILLLLIGGYVVDQSVAQQGDEPYECFAYGDPHVVTWHPKLKSGYNTRHYNIHVWQMKSLSERSTGICQRNDPACLKKPSKSGLEVSSETIWSRAGSITENQARTICKTHINTFLGKSRKAPYMRSINTNDTISIVMDACVQDVLLTGVPEMARSSTDVLMIEELTADVTSISSLKNVIETGMPQAIIAYNQAAEEAAVEIPQVLGLSTTTTQTTPVAITSSSTLTTTSNIQILCNTYFY